MKTSSSLIICLSLSFAAPALTAAPRDSRDYVQQTKTFDAAGGKATSSRYSQTTIVGGIGGAVSSAGLDVVARIGYTGQLSESTNLLLHAEPSILNEGATSRLSATALLDDGTVSQLDGKDLFWHAASGPVASIDAQGVLTAAHVYQRSSARIEGRHPGKIAFIDIAVVDVGDDDFRLYAHDGLPDLWQVQYFGENSPDGVASGDADGDGQSNFAEFVAGTSPTNAVSRFQLELVTLPNQPAQKYLFFSPRLDDRSYTVEYSLDLGAGFKPLTNNPQLDFGDTRVVLDIDTSESRKFYRVKISR
jgi:hypothetical protein